MNYIKVYDQIITRAQNRQLEGYKERHHILPKCLGGTNNKNNLVELTAREHFLCYKLLVEIYPNESKLKWAMYHMSKYKKYGSKEYEKFKIELNKLMIGRAVSLETREKISKGNKGRIVSNETRQKISKPRSEQAKINMRKPKSTTEKMKGPKSETHIQNLRKPKYEGFGLAQSKRLKGIPKPPRTKEHSSKFTTPVYQYDLKNNFIEKYNSMIEAGEKTGANPSTIGMVCRNKQKTAGGYIWKYN